MQKPANTIATLTICYESGSGDMTQRGVSVTEFNSHEMFGFCHLRERYRTFLFERIFSCVNVQTGEVVNDVSAHLASIYQKSPRYTIDLIYRNHYEALQILLYVGRADGQLREPERKVITAFCKVHTGDVRITDELARELIDSTNTPSLHGFKVAVGKVANRGNKATMKRLLIASTSIVKTQKSTTASEQEALDYMTKRFAEHIAESPTPHGDEA